MTSIGAMIRREIPPGEVADLARGIQHGFDELWLVEDLPYAGGISQAAVVLEATATVTVGHGIAPAPFRNPAALAMEWATLAEVYPGRFAAGIGHGVQTWMAQIGERVESPLTLLRETIQSVRGLLAGDTVAIDGRYVRLDNVALQFPPALIPRVSAGVIGPRSLRLSGEIADGTILSEGHGPAEIERARKLTEQGRANARRIEPHRLTVFAGFFVGDPNGLAEPNPDAPTGWDAVATEPGGAINKLQTLIDAGADAVILVPFGNNQAAQLHLAASEIVPHLVRT
jgi:alkanesulfonate monooxygenase SsuD/methylene tetrahydromethanopterin reductase-like flavin-dependent oxidoreductase (luciferase family)